LEPLAGIWFLMQVANASRVVAEEHVRFAASADAAADMSRPQTMIVTTCFIVGLSELVYAHSLP
jgi:hypothetical protein